MSVSDVFLNVENLGVQYGRVTGVEDVTFSVGRHEAVALVGPNGAGKTSTLRAIAGLMPRSGVRLRGEIILEGTSVRGSTPWDVSNLGVAMVPAITKVFAHLSVKEHLQLAGLRLGQQELAAAQERALDLFPRLRDRIGASGAMLSGGERQMLALAAATIRNPSLLMVDELSQGLAPSAVSVIVAALRSLVKEGMALLIVEQSLGTALALADRYYVMEAGRIVGEHAGGDVEGSDGVRSSYFGARDDGRDPHTRASIISPSVESAASEVTVPRVRVNDVSVHFKGLSALKDVTIEVRAKEMVGLIGPNGAGKSTLLNCINGAVRPSKGEIWIKGEPTRGMPAHRVSRLGVARTFQSAELWKSMEVMDVVQLGTHPLRVRNRAGREMAEEALDFVGLQGIESRRVSDLPYGYAKLVDLARALAAKPDILLLDEPASGLTQKERTAMIEILNRIRHELHLTALLVEHDMQMVRDTCPSIFVLSHGSVIGAGEPDTVLGQDDVARELLGLSRAE